MPSKFYTTLKASVRRQNGRDLTQRQLVLLGALCEEPVEVPRTVLGLAKELRQAKPTISRAHRRLGAAGLVRSVRDEVDKRNVRLWATAKGRAFWGKMTEEQT